MIGVLPARPAFRKTGITAPYAPFGSWRGPYTLNRRSATVSIPSSSYRRHHSSPAAFDTEYGERRSRSAPSRRGGSSPPYPAHDEAKTTRRPPAALAARIPPHV